MNISGKITFNLLSNFGGVFPFPEKKFKLRDYFFRRHVGLKHEGHKEYMLLMFVNPLNDFNRYDSFLTDS